MSELALAGQRVLIREDLNVPIANGQITDASRIEAALPTLRSAVEANARVIVLSHLGRPTEGVPEPQYSLAPVAVALSERLGLDVPLAVEYLGGVEVEPGGLVLCENVRFLSGEKANDHKLAKQLAALCDVYVNDAFATAHRAQASTHGVAQFAPVVCAGPLLQAELDALERALKAPKSPVVAIVGGAKVSSKLTVLDTLLDKVDQLIVGGGITNTFLKATGYEIGKSLHEPELLETARQLIAKANALGAAIPLPTDVVCASEFSALADVRHKPVNEVQPDEMILDIGPQTAEALARLLLPAGTIVWNGPVGVFEFDAFAAGTRKLAATIAAAPGFSIAGGGDTLSAISKFGITNNVSYISTGGGAFLEYLEGRELPAVSVLEARDR